MKQNETPSATAQHINYFSNNSSHIQTPQQSTGKSIAEKTD
jgi:hypothetical protein